MSDHLQNSWGITGVRIVERGGKLTADIPAMTNVPLEAFYGLTNEIGNVIKEYNKNSTRNNKAIEHGKINKHAMHLLRLYMMCIDILEYGQIINMTIKPAKIGTVAFLEYTTPSEAIRAVRALDDAYAVDEATPINQIPQTLDSLCVDFAYSDGITRHHRQGVTPIFIKGLPSDMKRGDLKIICIEFGDLAKTRLSKIDNGHGIKCSATIEYVRKDSTRLALAYLGDLFHKYGYNTVKVEKYNTNRNSYKPHP